MAIKTVCMCVSLLYAVLQSSSFVFVFESGCFVFLFRKKMLFFMRPHVRQVPVVSSFSSAAAAADSNDIHYTRNMNIYQPSQATNNTTDN